MFILQRDMADLPVHNAGYMHTLIFQQFAGKSQFLARIMVAGNHQHFHLPVMQQVQETVQQPYRLVGRGTSVIHIARDDNSLRPDPVHQFHETFHPVGLVFFHQGTVMQGFAEVKVRYM